MKTLFSFLFRRPKPELVRYHDFSTGKMTMIPKAELGPGAVLVQIQGEPHPVYADSTQLKEGPYQHPPFEGEMKEAIMSLVTDLAEVHPLSFDQWEDGFRRDRTPDQEVAGWLHLAAILKTMTDTFSFDPSERKECFRILVACYTGERATVRERSDPKLLPDEQINLAIKYFFEGVCPDGVWPRNVSFQIKHMLYLTILGLTPSDRPAEKPGVLPLDVGEGIRV